MGQLLSEDSQCLCHRECPRQETGWTPMQRDAGPPGGVSSRQRALGTNRKPVLREPDSILYSSYALAFFSSPFICSQVFWKGLPVAAVLMEPKGACMPTWTRTFHEGSNAASRPPGMEVERREVKRSRGPSSALCSATVSSACHLPWC